MSMLKSLIMLSAFAASLFAQSTQLRAFWIQGSGPESNNTPEVFRLFKKLGYNTVMECVLPPSDPAKWKIPQFVVEPASRAALINYVKDQKTKANQSGLSYCPFFNEWGWGGALPSLDERADAMVYREVNYIGNYYGKDVFKPLIKTTGGWGDANKITSTFDTSRSKITFLYGGAAGANGCARISLDTRPLPSRPFATLPDHLINGQCYDVGFVADLTNANLSEGDYLRVYIFREFVQGQKPDPASLPLGKLEYPGNNTRPVLVKQYSVTSVSQNGYGINNGPAPVKSIAIKLRVWTESMLPIGRGHGFNDVFRVDWEVFSNRCARNSTVIISDITIVGIDPCEIVTNKAWEQNSFYKTMTEKYPDEKKRETKAVYDVSGDIIENRYFLDPHPPGGALKKIKGHFRPFTTDCELSPLAQRPVDPLSPVTDLATAEMLRIIKDGLNNSEPDYFCINSDEVNVFRRDFNNIENGLSGTIYNNCSNGEYFGRIIRKHIERYKSVFCAGGKAKTNFIIYGDMILPFAGGYYFYAERNNDSSALSYLKNSIPEKLSVAVWSFDYMGMPFNDPSMLKEFELNDNLFMSKIISRITSNNLGYIAWYATDGATRDLEAIDPKISTDGAHIQHEINLARKWCDLTTCNPSHFTGYMYCGWNTTFKANRNNGIYPLAYFGWVNPGARDFPEAWKAVSTSTRGDNNEPVLDMLAKGIVPWPDSTN